MSPKSKRAFLSLQPLMLAISFVVIQILYGMFLILCFEFLYRDLILHIFKNNIWVTGYYLDKEING